MKKRLILLWYTMYIVCALLGFIPNPQGFWKFLFISLSLLFFVPGFCLLVWANNREDMQTIRRIRNLSLIWLCVTTLLILLNFASALMSKLAGIILNGMFVVLAAPMACGPCWALSLFLWACLLFTALSMLKKSTANQK